MKKQTVSSAFAILFLGSCFSTFLNGHRFEVRAEERIRMGMSTTPSPGFLPTVIAEKKGFYRKYGLVSEHITIALSIGMNALGTGDLDYANGLTQPLAAAIRGVPVKLIMFTQDKLVFFLLVKPSVEKVADLKGKTVGISYFGSTAHTVAEAVLRAHGLVPGKDVNLLPSGDDQGRLVSLETGRIDAAFGGPPFNNVAVRRGYKILARAADYVKVPQNGVIATEKKLQQSPDQVKRMIKATIEALEFIKKRREEATDVLAQLTKVDKDTAKEIFESYASAYSTDGTMTDEALQAAVEEASKRAKMEKTIPLSQIADRRLLSEAQRELGLK